MSEETLPATSLDGGRSLIDRIEKLTIALGALIDVNKQLCKKIESNELKLASIAKFVAEQSSERPSFGVL